MARIYTVDSMEETDCEEDSQCAKSYEFARMLLSQSDGVKFVIIMIA
jgi:hypothetical protein